MTYEEQKEKFYYDMARNEIKEQRLKDMSDEGAAADYNDLTVTDDDFEEGERDRFQSFLKQRKEDKELGVKFYGDKHALREKEGYDDDYLASVKEEMGHPTEEAERVTDLLNREKPKTERLR